MSIFCRDKSIGSKLMTANDSMIVAVNWISRIFVHLDNFCNDKRMRKKSSLSPGYFMALDFPVDSTYKLRPWFIEIWNTKLVHKLRNFSYTFLNDNETSQNNQLACSTTLKEGIEDPIKFIIRTWPWKEDAEAFSLPQVLIPVFNRSTSGCDSYDDNDKTTNGGSFSSANGVVRVNEKDTKVDEENSNYGRIVESSNTPSSTLINGSGNNSTQDDPLVSILSIILH